MTFAKNESMKQLNEKLCRIVGECEACEGFIDAVLCCTALYRVTT